MTDSVAWGTRFANGATQTLGAERPAFIVSLKDRNQQQHLFHSDLCAVARAFVDGEFDISGDIVSAIRVLRRRIHPGLGGRCGGFLSRFSPAWLESFLQSRTRAAKNIRFHYDRSNRHSLRSSIPSAANSTSGAETSGCTLSHNQYEFASSLIASRGLAKHASIAEVDYRGLHGRFQKVSSIGMFEHVGRGRLGQYFRTIHGLLEEGGLFLNSGITRPQRVGDDAETRFLRAQVFPGGELAHLSNIIGEAENAGFSILQTESVRLHYARTCREWIARLH